ncbi:S9 family peptidase [Brevibacterium sp. 50QC2O2]|uniref:alpha/beta hydrolase family protein n=1 Tax=Brevibacterium sp. 50QC2O2 TaxID=2968459 RepID=UPI00211BD778|nr:S9 family peptidase [Brevibacterium sp. 50QC2O2]MCQ9389078.1 S9 family peptidase [Brevibacterium sp. 50QC2O2]
MTPEDIDAVHQLADPVAWGQRVLFTLRRPQTAQDAYTGQVFATDGAVTRRISHGFNDSHLRSCAGGFALLRAARGGVAQLHIGEHPGATRVLTNVDLGVDDFAVSPNGDSALVLARIPEEGRYGTDPEVSADAEAPRRITHPQYLHNGLGYFRDRGTVVFEIAIPEAGVEPVGVDGIDSYPVPEVLPELPGDTSDPQYSPSGLIRSAVAGRHDDIDEVDLRDTVWVYTAEGPRALEIPKSLAVHSHRWIDDTRCVLVAQDFTDGPTDFIAQLSGVYVHDTATGATERLTDAASVDAAGGLLQLVDGRVYFGVVTDGAIRLTALELDAVGPATLRDLHFLTPADAVVSGFAFAADGSLVFTAAVPDSFGELFRVPAAALDAESATGAGIAPEALTDFGGVPDAVVPEAIKADGSGGEVHGWVAVPRGPGPHPVILNIHGGPFSQYTHALFDETQVLVAAGYAVVYSNPRGSNGRGRDWGLAVKGDMAEPAAADVLAVLDTALAAHPELDGTRIGVQGGSYGGYLTAMLIGSQEGTRFSAAIVERGYLVPGSFYGTSDIGRYFTDEYTGPAAEDIARQSPIERAALVRIPTLVMHSERDLRCPLEQGQQYYAALRRAGVPAELLIFPGENHELSRAGRPRHRAQRFEAVLEWWSKHLPVA